MERRLVAIDEKVIKLVDTKECLAVWVSEGRSRIKAYTFLRKIVQYCENKPK